MFDAYFKKFLISAVARVFNPGCKVDTVLVLQGKQGCGKSTLFQVLGKDWYGNSMSIAATKNNISDELAIAARGFIQEYAEFDGIVSSKNVAEFKEFVSRQVDTYRIPYDKTPKERPRRFVIVGTTNEEEFLKDPTGNRRFWVIPVVVDKIDTSLLEEEVEGIWASAVDAFLSGNETWHLNQIEEEARKRLNKKFQVSDEWENPIGDYLQEKEAFAITSNTKPMVAIKELLNVIGQNPDDRRSQNRVSKILQSLKWIKLGQRLINGKRQYVWTNPSVLLNPSEVKLEVKQPETIDQQGLSQPTQPTQPNFKTSIEERQNIISEKENTSNPSCEQNSLNRLSTLSRLSNSSYSQASSPTSPTTQPQQRLSNQATIERNQFATHPVDTVKNPTLNNSTDRRGITANTNSEEERYLQVCDVAGHPLETKNMVQLHYEYPTITERVLGEIIDVKVSDLENIEVIVQWKNEKEVSTYHVKDDDSSFPLINQLRKVVEVDGQSS